MLDSGGGQLKYRAGFLKVNRTDIWWSNDLFWEAVWRSTLALTQQMPAIPSTPAQQAGLSLDIVRWLQLRIPDTEENHICPQTPLVGEDTDLLMATKVPGSHRPQLDTTTLKRMERQERIIDCRSRIRGVRTPKQRCYQEETESQHWEPSKGQPGIGS